MRKIPRDSGFVICDTAMGTAAFVVRLAGQAGVGELT